MIEANKNHDFGILVKLIEEEKVIYDRSK